jgi:GxxExxY protein
MPQPEPQIQLALQACYEVHRELGSGFPEHIYRNAAVVAMRQLGLDVRPEAGLEVCFRGVVVGTFSADIIIVPGPFLFELKVAETIEDWHEAQILSYLRSSRAEIGYLFLFGSQPKYRRYIYTNDRKANLTPPVA